MKKQDHKFIEKSLVISFWAMLVTWAIIVILMTNSSDGIYLNALIGIPLVAILVISPVFNFVVSIIHLNKVKEKTFAVISLVISSIITFLELLILTIAIFISI